MELSEKKSRKENLTNSQNHQIFEATEGNEEQKTKITFLKLKQRCFCKNSTKKSLKNKSKKNQNKHKEISTKNGVSSDAEQKELKMEPKASGNI